MNYDFSRRRLKPGSLCKLTNDTYFIVDGYTASRGTPVLLLEWMGDNWAGRWRAVVGTRQEILGEGAFDVVFPCL